MTSEEFIQKVRLNDTVKIVGTTAPICISREGMQLRDNCNPLVTLKLNYPESIFKKDIIHVDCHWIQL